MSKLSRRVLATILLLIVAVVLAGVISTWLERRAWRSDAIAVLRAAQTPEQLENAVGKYGVFIPLRDGNWIAIHYKDSHSSTVRSLAVARDSGGRWFESTFHFCGRLGMLNAAINADVHPNSDDGGYGISIQNSAQEMMEWKIYQTTDLQTAREELLKIGFSPLD